MTSSNNLEPIGSQFDTKPEDMSCISSSYAKPSYSILHRFEQANDTNAMTIPYYQMNLGQLALTRKQSYFRFANGNNSFALPVILGDTPTQTPRVTTSQ